MFIQEQNTVIYIKIIVCEKDIYLYFSENEFVKITTLGASNKDTLLVMFDETQSAINKQLLFNFILKSMEGINSTIYFEKNNYFSFIDNKFIFKIGNIYKEIIAEEHSIYSKILRQLEFFYKNIEYNLQEIYTKYEDSDTEIDE